MLHDIFHTEVVPSFEDKNKRRVILQVVREGVRENKGAINVDTIDTDSLELITPLIKKSIKNETLKVEKISADLASFQKRQRKALKTNQAEMLNQYQISIFNKNLKIEFLVAILDKALNRISKENSSEQAIIEVLNKN